MTPALYPAILPTGGFTLDTMESVFRQQSPTSATRARQGPEAGFRGRGCHPAPFARHNGSPGQTGAELLKGSMTEKKWLLLCQRHRNSGIGRMRISSLCPSALRPKKWVWASARKMRLAASGKPNALLALPKGRKSPPGYYANSILEFLPERN